MKWNLSSFYYFRNKINTYESIRDNSELMLVDSGAHSFQYGIKVDWEEYTKQYAAFIREHDTPNTLGYFEMDVDNIIGYENVLKLRRILETASSKIIPVWHKNRGIKEYVRMCEEYSGRIIAVTGFKNLDIRDEQYPVFLKTAWDHKCKVHCLGMTRKEVLNKIPFDYVDSASWRLNALNGRFFSERFKGKKISQAYSKGNYEQTMYYAYLTGMDMQEQYYNKWRNVNND